MQPRPRQLAPWPQARPVIALASDCSWTTRDGDGAPHRQWFPPDISQIPASSRPTAWLGCQPAQPWHPPQAVLAPMVSVSWLGGVGLAAAQPRRGRPQACEQQPGLQKSSWFTVPWRFTAPPYGHAGGRQPRANGGRGGTLDEAQRRGGGAQARGNAPRR
jgi:hypothetical protein